MQKGIVCTTVVGLIQISNVLIMALRFIIRCPKITVFYQFFSSERFFYDSRRTETLAFSQLKVLIFALVNKKKEPIKRTAILGHVKRLNV